MSGRAGTRVTNAAVPAVFAAMVLLVAGITFAIMWRNCLRQTDGHFIYALDDPYIHLSIAKNLAQHGVWGVTQYAAASASSSPLWSFLLGVLIWIGGNNVLWPLIFGIVFSIAATLLVYTKFQQQAIAA